MRIDCVSVLGIASLPRCAGIKHRRTCKNDLNGGTWGSEVRGSTRPEIESIMFNVFFVISVEEKECFLRPGRCQSLKCDRWYTSYT